MQVTILESGVVEVVAVRDGHPWRGVITPGDEAMARELLGDEAEAVIASWTSEQLKAARPVPPGLPTTTADRRAASLAAINERKNVLRDGGFLVGGTLFDSDAAARLAYAELAMRLQSEPSFSTAWKASAGQWVTMDAALFSQVYAAGAAHIAGAFAWQQAEEERLAATADEDLAAFVVGA